MELCIECKKRPVHIKKRELCSVCYGRLYQRKKKLIKPGHDYCSRTTAKMAHDSEILFIKNFFTHSNWFFRPTTFRFNGTSYSPDFYDGETNTFIEVSGTRQAYSFNKDKYQKFRETFPKLSFEIRNSDGEIIDESKPINSQI